VRVRACARAWDYLLEVVPAGQEDGERLDQIAHVGVDQRAGALRGTLCACVCVFLCFCVRACVRACVRVRACAQTGEEAVRLPVRQGHSRPHPPPMARHDLTG
jgi:hypothetical protein